MALQGCALQLFRYLQIICWLVHDSRVDLLLVIGLTLHQRCSTHVRCLRPGGCIYAVLDRPKSWRYTFAVSGEWSAYVTDLVCHVLTLHVHAHLTNSDKVYKHTLLAKGWSHQNSAQITLLLWYVTSQCSQGMAIEDKHKILIHATPATHVPNISSTVQASPCAAILGRCSVSSRPFVCP